MRFDPSPLIPPNFHGRWWRVSMILPNLTELLCLCLQPPIVVPRQKTARLSSVCASEILAENVTRDKPHWISLWKRGLYPPAQRGQLHYCSAIIDTELKRNSAQCVTSAVLTKNSWRATLFLGGEGRVWGKALSTGLAKVTVVTTLLLSIYWQLSSSREDLVTDHMT